MVSEEFPKQGFRMSTWFAIQLTQKRACSLTTKATRNTTKRLAMFGCRGVLLSTIQLAPLRADKVALSSL
jgi:hypothetical protein